MVVKYSKKTIIRSARAHGIALSADACVCVRVCARIVCAHQSRRLTPHMYDVRNRIFTRTPNANRQIFLAVCLRTDKISVGQ